MLFLLLNELLKFVIAFDNYFHNYQILVTNFQIFFKKQKTAFKRSYLRSKVAVD